MLAQGHIPVCNKGWFDCWLSSDGGVERMSRSSRSWIKGQGLLGAEKVPRVWPGWSSMFSPMFWGYWEIAFQSFVGMVVVSMINGSSGPKRGSLRFLLMTSFKYIQLSEKKVHRLKKIAELQLSKIESVVEMSGWKSWSDCETINGGCGDNLYICTYGYRALSLDPGRPLPGLDVAVLLSFDVSWVTSDAASYRIELANLEQNYRIPSESFWTQE